MSNDDKILSLREKATNKIKELGKNTSKFVPITSCSIQVDGISYNIHVATKEQLVGLLVRLNAYKMSAVDLNLLDEYVISGYKINDWISDIKTKLDIILHKEEQDKLRKLDKKLDEMLSSDKKVELELEQIAKLLDK
jgi:hypothetical protein